MNKVKLFTHGSDFDGVGCAILAKIAAMAIGDSVDIEYCNYNDINEKVKDFLFGDDIYLYHKTYITDISVSREIADQIQISIDNQEAHFKLIDHHKTALFLNEYEWCNVQIEDEKGLCSGTSLFAKELFLECSDCLSKFIEIVRRYDSWEWSTKYNDEEPKRWNDLLYILGREDFIYSVIPKLTLLFDLTFSELEEWALNQRQNEIDHYIKSKSKQLIKTTIDGYNAGVVFAEKFTSELGDKLCKLNPDIDFIAIINPSHSVSYRTIKDVDLSEVAKMYSGGGHAKASGSPITNEQRQSIINLLFGW